MNGVRARLLLPRPVSLKSTKNDHAGDTSVVYNFCMSEEWLTTAEASELSGYHPEYIRDLMRDDKIDGRKFGIVWQVSKESLESYLESAKDSVDKRWGPKP